MARVRKAQPTLESVFFSTPEQKVMRMLISESTTTFTPRVISSKLKGVRGLGGTEGIMTILEDLESLGLVDFVDNHRAVRVHDDNSTVHMLKRFAAICDLETLRKLLEPVSTKGILFGSRATGRARSDSDYDLFVVTDTPEQVREIAGSHPLGKLIEIVAWTPELYTQIEKQDPKLLRKLEAGIVLWGSTW
jgi:predicted nucleotidyltransferase